LLYGQSAFREAAVSMHGLIFIGLCQFLRTEQRPWGGFQLTSDACDWRWMNLPSMAMSRWKP